MQGRCCVRRCGLGVMAALVVGLGTISPVAADEPNEVRRPSISAIAGTLFICGGGRLPEQLPRTFLELAGGREARLVVVTTASRMAGAPEMEDRLEYWRHLEVRSLAVLHAPTRDVADDPEFSAPLADATGVWFIGGDQNKLSGTYLGTKTAQRFHELLRRGGVIGGTSAGAAIMSRVMIRGGRDEPVLGAGLGFLTGAIVDQHFLKRQREGRLMKAVRARPGLVGLGIDEGTALVVHGTQLRVLGESEVRVCLPPRSSDASPKIEALKPGDEADLQELCGLAAD